MLKIILRNKFLNITNIYLVSLIIIIILYYFMIEKYNLYSAVINILDKIIFI